MDSKNLKYLIPSIILLILSAFGIFYIINSSKSTSTPIVSNEPVESIPTPEITNIPTISITPTATSSTKTKITPIATPTATKKLTPTATPSAKITPTVTPKITTTPILTPTPTPTATPITGIEPDESTPTELTFSSSTDGFSIIYNSYRKLYQDKETSGNRYTFYSNSGNFAVHVGLNNQWAWTTPNRNFSGNLVISGQNTYRYDTDAQTIVDIQYNSKNYTLQCIHNGKATLKAECETFLKSFKLL